MESKLDLSIDIEKNTLQLDENPPIKLKNSKGLLILDFLNKHQDKPLGRPNFF